MTHTAAITHALCRGVDQEPKDNGICVGEKYNTLRRSTPNRLGEEQRELHLY